MASAEKRDSDAQLDAVVQPRKRPFFDKDGNPRQPFDLNMFTMGEQVLTAHDVRAMGEYFAKYRAEHHSHQRLDTVKKELPAMIAEGMRQGQRALRVLYLTLQDYSLPELVGSDEQVLIKTDQMKERRFLRTEARNVYDFVVSLGGDVVIEPVIDSLSFDKYIVIASPEGVLDQNQVIALLFMVLPLYD